MQLLTFSRFSFPLRTLFLNGILLAYNTLTGDIKLQSYFIGEKNVLYASPNLWNNLSENSVTVHTTHHKDATIWFQGWGGGEQKLPPGSKQFLSSNHTETNLFSFLPSRYSYLENSKSKHVPRKVPHRKQRVTLSVQDPEIAITELSGIIHQISSKSVKIIMWIMAIRVQE